MSADKAGRVIVCGGRDFDDRDGLFRVLDRVHSDSPINILWHGNARGADTLAGQWARSRGVQCAPTPAQWKKHGKAAGPKRNQAMLGQGIGRVVAFPGGRGTADMVARARKAGVRVITATPTGPQAKAEDTERKRSEATTTTRGAGQ